MLIYSFAHKIFPKSPIIIQSPVLIETLTHKSMIR